MKYTFEKAEKSTVKIEITLTAKEWDAAIDKAYEKTKGRYSMPGFRKGRVPKHLLIGTYGKGIFYEDAINESFPQYYSEVLEKEPSIEAVASPELDIKKISATGLTLVATVAVKPEVTLGEYKGITFKKVEYNVKDEDVEEELNRLKERNSRMVDVTDRAAENGDTVIIDYSGSVGGVKFDGGTAEKQSLTLGSKAFIPGFEEQVEGMKIGEEKDITVKFPDDYHAENLKGKEAVFAIKLHEINVKEVPQLDDESVKDISEFDTVADFKESIKKDLLAKKTASVESKLENDIIEKIANESTVEIPECMVDNQIEEMIYEFESRLQYQGLKAEDYYKYTGIKRDDLKKQYADMAKKNVLFRLTLEALLKEIQIPVSDEEINEKIADMAKEAGKTFEEYSKYMNDEYKEYLRRDIITNKLFEYLKNNNTIK